MKHGITTVYNFRTTYLLFALFTNVFVTMYMILNDDNTIDANTQHAHYFRFIYCTIWFICGIWYLKDRIKGELNTNTTKYFIWFTIGTFASLCISHSGNILILVSNILLFASSCLTLMGCYSYGYKYGKTNNILYIVAITILACAFAYASIYKTYNILGSRGHFGVAYYALYLLPLILASDKRWIRISSIIIVSVVIISSIKRGGLVALTLGLFVYIFVSRMIAKKSLKSLMILFITLLVLAVFLYILVIYLGDNIIERLFDANDDTGSGRLEIWNSLFYRLKDQSITLWIFGNGHLSTTTHSWENLSAHNDFLEILYNYGIVNLITYTFFILSVSFYTIRAIRQSSKLAPCLAMLLTIYIILSMISIIILSHTCTLSMISFGFLIGWNEHEQQQSLQKI